LRKATTLLEGRFEDNRLRRLSAPDPHSSVRLAHVAGAVDRASGERDGRPPVPPERSPYQRSRPAAEPELQLHAPAARQVAGRAAEPDRLPAAGDPQPRGD